MTVQSELAFGLSSKTIQKICTVFMSFPAVKSVVIYGSRSMGTFRNGSDIDLVIMDSGIAFRDVLKIENAIDDLLLPYKIDLSLFEHIQNQDLIAHINEKGRVFYS